jgi:hypothetical protein
LIEYLYVEHRSCTLLERDREASFTPNTERKIINMLNIEVAEHNTWKGAEYENKNVSFNPIQFQTNP